MFPLLKAMWSGGTIAKKSVPRCAYSHPNHTLHPGIAINAGMNGGGVGSLLFHAGSQAVIQMTGAVAFGIGEHGRKEKRTHEVHIHFEGHATRVVGERLWHATQAIRKLNPDGSVFEFQADLSGLEEITRWVLSWGSKARVLGPPELVKRVREELKGMMKTSE
jgi:hypothetical protein